MPRKEEEEDIFPFSCQGGARQTEEFPLSLSWFDFNIFGSILHDQRDFSSCGAMVPDRISSQKRRHGRAASDESPSSLPPSIQHTS